MTQKVMKINLCQAYLLTSTDHLLYKKYISCVLCFNLYLYKITQYREILNIWWIYSLLKTQEKKYKKNVKGMCEIAHIISWHFTKAQLLSCIYTDYQNDDKG